MNDTEYQSLIERDIAHLIRPVRVLSQDKEHFRMPQPADEDSHAPLDPPRGLAGQHRQLAGPNIVEDHLLHQDAIGLMEVGGPLPHLIG